MVFFVFFIFRFLSFCYHHFFILLRPCIGNLLQCSKRSFIICTRAPYIWKKEADAAHLSSCLCEFVLSSLLFFLFSLFRVYSIIVFFISISSLTALSSLLPFWSFQSHCVVRIRLLSWILVILPPVLVFLVCFLTWTLCVPLE